MFNATEIRMKAKHATRLDCYFKRINFGTIVRELVREGVPESEIMQTFKGPRGYTMLNDAFFLDFMAWIGGVPYYRALRKYVKFPSQET